MLKKLAEKNIQAVKFGKDLVRFVTHHDFGDAELEEFGKRIGSVWKFSFKLYPFNSLNWLFKKIKIIIDVPDRLTIDTDKFILQTIIGNLVNNAIKFSNQYSEINVSLLTVNGIHNLVVKDHGIGIEESQLRNIFLLGKISTGRGTLGEGGTGLGLVLVKELVEKLNWNIEVKSKGNAGSEFIVIIPK